MAYIQATASTFITYILSEHDLFNTNLSGYCIITYYQVVTTLLVVGLTLFFWMTGPILFAPTSLYMSLVQRLPIIIVHVYLAARFDLCMLRDNHAV